LQFEDISEVVIAPFWHDVDIRMFGSIYYRLSPNDTDISKLQNILTAAFSLMNSEIQQILVATYDRIALFGDSNNRVSWQ